MMGLKLIHVSKRGPWPHKELLINGCGTDWVILECSGFKIERVKHIVTFMKLS